MSRITMIIGGVLIAIGLGFAINNLVGPNDFSVTSLIPSFIGVVYVGLGALGLIAKIRMHVMHVAVLLSVVLAVGLFMMMAETDRPGAWWAQLLSAITLVVHVLLGIGSFMKARTQRQGPGARVDRPADAGNNPS